MNLRSIRMLGSPRVSHCCFAPRGRLGEHDVAVKDVVSVVLVGAAAAHAHAVTRGQIQFQRAFVHRAASAGRGQRGRRVTVTAPLPRFVLADLGITSSVRSQTQELSPSLAQLRFLPERGGELTFPHRHLFRRAGRVLHGWNLGVALHRDLLVNTPGRPGAYVLRRPVHVASRYPGVFLREALELFLQVFPVIHGASARS